jgi:putative FmdB family regulatory protein
VPIYVYECSSCGNRFEYTQSISEPPKTVCENCSGRLEKIIVPIAFHLKGGGWYKDLYSSNKASSSSGGDGAAKPEGKSETKTESKSEGKTETKKESKSTGGDK